MGQVSSTFTSTLENILSFVSLHLECTSFHFRWCALATNASDTSDASYAFVCAKEVEVQAARRLQLLISCSSFRAVLLLPDL